ncbi:MAG: PepSY domain-containing protein [Firmicutes bacterium]|nr:PepSY domain-containing protein [Bacillota bacterium]
MKKITQVLNSPLRIGGFALVILLLVAAVAFGSMQVGAGVNSNKTIGLDKGVNVALQDAGFTSEEVSGLIAHYDNDDGVATYEVDFVAGGFEYEYTIKANDGTIIEASREAAETPVLKENEIKFEDQVQKDLVQPVQQPVQNEQPQQSAEVQQPPVQSQEAQKPQVPSEPTSKYIGVDKAKSIALSDAGIKSSAATFTKAKLDKDDGVATYEIEFFSGNTEYEYEISATSGKILDRDSDREDWDDDDWDD